MKYSEYNKKLHKFTLSNDIKEVLNNDDITTLAEIGIPSIILSNTFIYNDNIIIDRKSNSLVLGRNTHVVEWTLKIDITSKDVYFSGKGQNTKEVYCFYNSSISKLLLCSFSFDFFLRRLLISETLGPYYDNTPKGGNFEKYAGLLKDLISDIDERAANEGAWHSLIEEMSIGVI